MPPEQAARPLLESPTFWTAVGALGTLLAVLVAMRHDLAGLFLRPDLRIDFKPLGAPDCDLNGPGTPVNVRGKFTVVPDGSYNLRIRVSNLGSRPAKGAQIELQRVERLKESDSKMAEKQFLPMHLVWCHLSQFGLLPFYHPLIGAKSGAHFDLAVLFKDPATGKPAALLNTVAHPPTWSTLLEPGTYRLTLVLTAGGQAPRTEYARFRVPDTWYPSEKETFEKGPGFTRDEA